MNEEEIKKMIADDFDNFINERLDGAIIFKYISNLEKENLKLKEQNERLLELCMYALIASTKIYNHELANDTKKLFIDIIKNNLNYDTYILKNKLLEAWRSDK